MNGGRSSESVRRALRTLAAALLAALASAASPACSSGDQPTGSGGGAGSGGGTPAFGTTDCGQCVKDQCADAFTACKSDPECSAYEDCLFACPAISSGSVDEGCASACASASTSEAATAEAAVDTCRRLGGGAKACAACNFDPKSALGDPLLHQMCSASSETATCPKCEAEKCCDTTDACHANAECKALLACVQGCIQSSPGCEADCAAMHPNGVADYGPFFGCIEDVCADPCATNPLDACEECVNTGPCGDRFAHLISTKEGFLVYACVTKCDGDPDCTKACFDQYPDELPGYQEYVQCVSLVCPSC